MDMSQNQQRNLIRIFEDAELFIKDHNLLFCKNFCPILKSNRNNLNKLILSLNTQRMLKVLVLSLLIASVFSGLIIDLNQKNKYGNQSIVNSQCNKDTQIDFFFTSDSKLSCTNTTCNGSGLGASTMKFMDIRGEDLVLNLVSAQTVKNGSGTTDLAVLNFRFGLLPQYYFVFKFSKVNQGQSVYVNQGQSVYVVVPINISASSNQVLDVEKVGGEFSQFQNLSTSAIDLSIFNYLNSRDYSRFYQVTNTALTETMLISTTILKLKNQVFNNAPFTTSFVPNYALSGNKLCYASNESSGLFQTHLRQSWPLWTWVISLFFYWLYYLLADAETHSCYDKRFQENKMTCWGFYSLHFLGHVEYFSRLSRLSLLYFVFSFQAIILAAIYSTRGMDKAPFTNMQMIIWTAVIAFAASIPIPFILGGIFLQGIYNTTLAKFEAIKKTRGTMLNKSKQQQALLQNQIDKLQQRLYTYYYVYYILFFCAMICFWVPSIYMMMKIHRDWYYLQRIWLASLAIAFVLDNLIFDPLMSFLLGNTAFYRKRGYFYRFQLGQHYKDIEE